MVKIDQRSVVCVEGVSESDQVKYYTESSDARLVPLLPHFGLTIWGSKRFFSVMALIIFLLSPRIWWQSIQESNLRLFFKIFRNYGICWEFIYHGPEVVLRIGYVSCHLIKKKKKPCEAGTLYPRYIMTDVGRTVSGPCPHK